MQLIGNIIAAYWQHFCSLLATLSLIMGVYSQTVGKKSQTVGKKSQAVGKKSHRLGFLWDNVAVADLVDYYCGQRCCLRIAALPFYLLFQRSEGQSRPFLPSSYISYIASYTTLVVDLQQVNCQCRQCKQLKNIFFFILKMYTIYFQYIPFRFMLYLFIMYDVFAEISRLGHSFSCCNRLRESFRATQLQESPGTGTLIHAKELYQLTYP